MPNSFFLDMLPHKLDDYSSKVKVLLLQQFLSNFGLLAANGNDTHLPMQDVHEIEVNIVYAWSETLFCGKVPQAVGIATQTSTLALIGSTFT